MLSWLIEVAPKGELTIPSVSLRILIVNFAAIHTSTMVRDRPDAMHLYLKVSFQTFSHVLYHLAASPEFQVELRKEIDTIVAECGWTKEALARMIKVDSFIKETARYEGLGSGEL